MNSNVFQGNIMIGKKNIVFGFIFLTFTASLGGVMVDMYEEYGTVAAEKQTAVAHTLTVILKHY